MERMEANIEPLDNLRSNLQEQGYGCLCDAHGPWHSPRAASACSRPDWHASRVSKHVASPPPVSKHQPCRGGGSGASCRRP
jgi:hypothetical protein